MLCDDPLYIKLCQQCVGLGLPGQHSHHAHRASAMEAVGYKQLGGFKQLGALVLFQLVLFKGVMYRTDIT